MATMVSYAATMCTRKTTSSSNAKSSAACQEFYDSSYNYVGIICFSGMNLANKVITGIWLDIDAASTGYGAGSTKTVFMRKANYQNSIQSGITGSGYKQRSNNSSIRTYTHAPVKLAGAFHSQKNDSDQKSIIRSENRVPIGRMEGR